LLYIREQKWTWHWKIKEQNQGKIISKNKVEQIFLKKGTNNNTFWNQKEVYHREQKVKMYLKVKKNNKIEKKSERNIWK
jgi:hypothetical protein